MTIEAEPQESAVRKLSTTYSLALRLRDAAMAPEIICEYVEVEQNTPPAFYRVAEEKLAAARREVASSAADALQRSRGRAVRLGIAAGSHTLDHVQAALDALWVRHGEVPTGVRVEVGIAAAEIAANILEHGRAGRLHMAIQVLPESVEIEFTDDGYAADVDLVAVRMPDEMAERGRGLALAQSALRPFGKFGIIGEAASPAVPKVK